MEEEKKYIFKRIHKLQYNNGFSVITLVCVVSIIRREIGTGFWQPVDPDTGSLQGPPANPETKGRWAFKVKSYKQLKHNTI